MARLKCLNLSKEILVEHFKQGGNIVEIAKRFGVTRETIYNRIKTWNIDRRKIRFNENFFETIDSEHKAYWLGFIMADGCVSRTHSDKLVIKLASKDKEHLEKWNKSIESNVKLYLYNYNNTISSQLYSSKICDDLEKIGCKPKKSLTLKFPNLQPDLIRHFVRGYFDGDGCASISNKKSSPQLRLSFVGTEDFLNDLKVILNIDNKLLSNGKAKNLVINGNKKTRKIVEWMYESASIFLDRKRQVCYSKIRI